MSVRVRPLESRDKPVWLVLFKGYIEFYQATVPEDVIETLWQRLMRGLEGFHSALVAVDDADSPIGFAHILLHRSTWSNGHYCYLEDLFVDPAQRGKGVGRALINGVYDQAKLAGSSRVYWQTHETNHTAMQLYDKVAERSGFVVYRKLF